MTDLTRIFGDAGPLASAIAGFRPRDQQLEMAQRVASAIAGNHVLVCEAGTGTGKTFAYIVPAMLSGAKVIVSTGTRTLQDQLFLRDLPTVRDALRLPVSVALLKGRQNYVCHYRLERAQAEGRFASREDVAHLQAIARFTRQTDSGDKAGCTSVPENSPMWIAVTSTRENCLGQECPHYKACFVLGARRAAMGADIVVVNHHLFFADVMLRDDGVGELLPACNAVIFDEAHQLPETASLFFGESMSTSQLLELARDVRNEALEAARDFLPLPEAVRALDKAARDLRLAFREDGARLTSAHAEQNPDFRKAVDELDSRLEGVREQLLAQADRSEGLANCLARAEDLVARLARWRQAAVSEIVRWVEVFPQSCALNATPLDVASVFSRQMQGHPRAWIFTSATLAVERDFSHFCSELGLESAETAQWGSPFDYASQALLYAPRDMPEPNSFGYHEAVADAAYPVIRAAGGRAFVLCTSLRAMRRVHELLQSRFEADQFDSPLLLQGEGSRTELLERFRFLGNATLVASQSFWEGVDVPGDALSLVVIDRLPFAPPDDPVLAARIEHMRRSGKNPFLEYQLPRAVINMKQGAGRLIRSETDRGVLMICDPRLVDKPYGKRVWRSLPPMCRTRELGEAIAFFDNESADD